LTACPALAENYGIQAGEGLPRSRAALWWRSGIWQTQRRIE